jgi:hypothetical protein
MSKPLLIVLVLAWTMAAEASVIRVPGDFSAIQPAVDAAAARDTILLGAGRYNESLVICKSLFLIGAGSTACVIHRAMDGDTPVVLIRDSAVELKGIAIVGSGYDAGWDWYGQVSSRGLSAENSLLALEDVAIDNISNCMAAVFGGGLNAAGVRLFTRGIDTQCDIGMALCGCIAFIDSLESESGRIDHVVDINHFFGDTDFSTSNVSIENSVFRASSLAWGESIRSFSNVNLSVRSCRFYRAPGEPTTTHAGVGFNGFGIRARVQGNIFTDCPRGVYFYGSLPNSNGVIIEDNRFERADTAAVLIYGAHYEGIDLGGGVFGSRGGNTFSGSERYDVELRNSNSDVYARHNDWSNFGDPGEFIRDSHDDGSLGTVIIGIPWYFRWAVFLLRPPDFWENVELNPELAWPQVKGADAYRVQVSTSSTFKETIFDLADIKGQTVRVGPLNYHTQYYWRVAWHPSTSSSGVYNWQDWHSFVTTYPKPPIASCSGPENGATGQSIVPLLSWNPLEQAAFYRLQVSKNGDFSDPVFDDSLLMGPQRLMVYLDTTTQYFWRVRGENADGKGEWSSPFSFRTCVRETGIRNEIRTVQPYTASLMSYPNPFNAATVFGFTVPERSRVTLKLYDVLGREAAVVAEGPMEPGRRTIRFDASGLPSGVYMARLEAGGESACRKIMLLK